MTVSRRTDDPITAEQLRADGETVLAALAAGGVAIVPLDVAYAVIGTGAAAIRSIFAAKERSYEKPSGMFGNLDLSREIHVLPSEKHEIARTIIERHGLPFSIVADYRRDHPIMRAVDPFVLESSTKGNTLDMLVNAGALHNEIARQSAEQGVAVFGSSANRSLTGSRYRLADIDPQVRAIAAVEIDHGTSKYANPDGRSSTIIDFRNFRVLRQGVCFDRLNAIFRDEFDIVLRLN
jgi:tRNA A37 threonylcarbamoyladenosine synthetase subunit TsaC/SUA5/YrdC